MKYTLVHHLVENYDDWRKVFDAAESQRKSAGERSFQVFTTSDNPNEVWVLNTWSDVDKTKAFFASPDLKEKMKAGGVIGEPKIHFLDEHAESS